MRQVRPLLLAAAALLGASVAHAQTGYYVAVPAQQPTKARIITRETPWSLRGDAYVAARAPERDAALCAGVVRTAGALTSFTVGGKPYDAERLAKCNSHARGGTPGTAVADAR